MIILKKLYPRRKYYKLLPHLFYRYQKTFVGSLTKRGRKLFAYNFLLRLKHGMKLKERLAFHVIFLLSFLNVAPVVLLSYLKLGGQKQGVPLHISWKKKITFSLKWMLGSLREKYKRLKMPILIDELLLAIHNRGLALKKQKYSYMEGDSNRFLIKRFKYRG